MNLSRPAVSRTKTYVVERVATDVYEIETADGESAALFEVVRDWYENTARPIKNLTEFRVFEKTDG
jgi:hypothetical protein